MSTDTSAPGRAAASPVPVVAGDVVDDGVGLQLIPAAFVAVLVDGTAPARQRR